MYINWLQLNNILLLVPFSDRQPASMIPINHTKVQGGWTASSSSYMVMEVPRVGKHERFSRCKMRHLRICWMWYNFLYIRFYCLVLTDHWLLFRSLPLTVWIEESQFFSTLKVSNLQLNSWPKILLLKYMFPLVNLRRVINKFLRTSCP